MSTVAPENTRKMILWVIRLTSLLDSVVEASFPSLYGFDVERTGGTVCVVGRVVQGGIKW